MPEEVSNPNRLLIFTNQPADAAIYESQGWKLCELLVLKFYPTLNPDWKNPKRYGLRFWRPEPVKQPNLL